MYYIGLNPLLTPGLYPPGGVDESIAADDDDELEEGEVSPPRSQPFTDYNIGTELKGNNKMKWISIIIKLNLPSGVYQLINDHH